MNLLKKTVLILTLLVVVGVSAHAYSDDYDRYPVWDKIIRKLGRGIANTAFGVFEFN